MQSDVTTDSRLQARHSAKKQRQPGPHVTFAVGDRVEVSINGTGTVRFVGPHHIDGTATSGIPYTGTVLDSPFLSRAARTVMYRVYWAMPLKTSCGMRNKLC